MTEANITTGVDNKWVALGRAIEQVLLADNQQQHWLGDDHPPFTTTMADALKFYGGPGVKFDLWCNCRAAFRLREIWVGITVSAES